MKLYIVLIALIIQLSFISYSYSEGTKQVMPDSTNGTALFIRHEQLQGTYRGAITENRVKINVKDHTVENIYMGFNPRMRLPSNGVPANAYYRVLNPSGGVVAGPTLIPSGGTGFIRYYSQAYAGPNIGGATPAGYTPITLDPTANGDYYIELYRSTDGGVTSLNTTDGELYLMYFDITVAKTDNTQYPGRLHCQKWSLITYDPTTANYPPTLEEPFEGDYYGYTADSSITKVEFTSGFRPYGFDLVMNDYGVANSGDWAIDRKSVHTGKNSPSLTNGYKVFLQLPDTSVFIPTSEPLTVIITGPVYGCPGSFFIPYYIDKAGDISILLDINGTSGYQSGTSDVLLEAYNVAIGNNVMEWDGLNGLGNPVTGGVQTNVTVSLNRGRTNIPMYDAELNTNGFSVISVIPTTGNQKLFWDDSGLTNSGDCSDTQDDNSAGSGVDNSSLGDGVYGPAHAWDGTNADFDVPAQTNGAGSSTITDYCDDFGNARTINTWFYVTQVASSPTTITIPDCDGDGDGTSDADDLDDDNDGISDLVESGGVDPLLDHDGDGIPNYLDPQYSGFTDSNLDGVNDNFDKDKDGIINELDYDSDNDAIPDCIEAGGVDANGDGVADSYVDLNGNGITDQYDIACTGSTSGRGDVVYSTSGTVTDPSNAVDNNNTTYAILDNTVSDGIMVIQLQHTVPNGTTISVRVARQGGTDGNVAVSQSTNGTSFTNSQNLTTNNTATDRSYTLTSDASYIRVARNSRDARLYIISYSFTAACSGGTAISNPDTDGDGIKNFLDLDSDNDGVTDVIEAGGVDTDGDGKVGSFSDVNRNGLADAYDINNTCITYSGRGNASAGTSGTVNNAANAYDASYTTYATIASTNAYIDIDLEHTVPSGTILSIRLQRDGGTNGNVTFKQSIDDATYTNTSSTITTTTTITDFNYTLTANANYIRVTRTNANSSRLYIINYSFESCNPTGGDIISNWDTDGDGVKNYLDLDSDNDGIPDVVEAGGADSNNDGKIDSFTDTDSDGLSQSVDGDNNNDGTVESSANALIISGTDGNSDGIPDTWTRANNDNNGKPNPYDLDADGDGILDVREAGLTDATNDGIADGTLGADGWSDTVDALGSLNLPNTDSHGNANFIDIDSDNDGIVDIVEAQTTAGYTAPSGSDSDDDGIDNNYDNNDAAFGGNSSNGLTPVNTDGTDNTDYTDLDSDNDRKSDRVEGWDTDGSGSTNGSEITYVGSTDSDNDGLLNEFDIDDATINPTNSSTPSSHPDMNNPGGDRDWRQESDRDNDGKVDTIDIDDDNDGIPDTIESGGYDPLADGDSDGIANYLDSSPGAGLPTWTDSNTDNINDAYDKDFDGIINELDLDSDNDGIPDIIEATGVDSGNDGLVDSYVDTDNDGLSDQWDSNNGGVSIPNPDSDGDGIKNFLDLDADGDGLLDVREAGFTDSNNDGIVDGTLGTDGWSNTIDALGSLGLTNTDSHGNPNYIDIDADNDGIVDIVEGQSTAGYQAPSGSDSDGDGIDNTYDNDDAAFGGNSNNGISPVNTESTDLLDYLDLDSDNDSKNDRIEGWDTNGNGIIDGGEIAFVGTTDSDGDGLFNEYDVNDASWNPTNSTTPSSHPDENDPGGDRDWREFLNGGGFLPIELLNASVYLENQVSVVIWSTASEKDNNYFIIEKSPDAINFAIVDKINGAGNSSSILHYKALDHHPYQGVSYYRIKQVDFDGKYTYSPIMTLYNDIELINIEIFPNPTSESFNIKSNKEFTYRITTIGGQEILNGNINHLVSNIDISHLESGTYIIIIQTNSETIKKIIIKK